jgi:hypothetical protein
MNFTIIAAVNNEQVLKSCLLGSPALNSNTNLILQRGFSSAALAYNQAIPKADNDILIFAHQDMFLPQEWMPSLQRNLDHLAKTDPNWGVLGIWGATHDGGRAGHLYWTGLHEAVGAPFEHPVEVSTLDEMILIFRKSSGLKFDPNIPGFHMYGPDICMEAKRRGMKSYVFSGFCVHNTNEYKMLPLQFWQAYMAMRKKWETSLPIHTTCTQITRFCWPMILWNTVRFANLALNRLHPKVRAEDPRQVYQSLLARRRHPAPAAAKNAYS